MPKLKNLGGDDLIRLFSQFGFLVDSQRGSHVKLRRTLASGTKQTLTVPHHKELDSGTLKAVLRQASRYIPEEDLKPLFYSS